MFFAGGPIRSSARRHLWVIGTRDNQKLANPNRPTMTRLPLTSLFIAIVSLAVMSVSNAQASELKAGPMVGATAMRQAKIWMQATGQGTAQIEYWDIATPERVRKSATVPLTPDNDFVGQFLVGLLEPGRSYGYRVLINGKVQKVPQTLAFKSQALWQWRTDALDWRMAFSSCGFVNEPAYDRLGRPYGGPPEAKRIYDTMVSAQPDLTLWGGDYLYFREADEDSELGLRYRWMYDRGTPEQQGILRTGSHIAIWDDHEFGPNDSNMSYGLKGEALRLFKLYWPNSSFGLPETPGTFGVHRFNDVDFFLLDNRSHRDHDDLKQKNKTMLGATQLRWLKNALLASVAPIKILVSGSQVTNEINRSEGWDKFPEEREAFLKFLTDHRINGVMILSGDRHFTNLLRTERPGTYALHELTCSPLLSGPSSTTTREHESKNPAIVPGTFVNQRNFCTLDFKGPRTDRRIVIRSVATDGQQLWERELKLSEMQTPRP